MPEDIPELIGVHSQMLAKQALYAATTELRFVASLFGGSPLPSDLVRQLVSAHSLIASLLDGDYGLPPDFAELVAWQSEAELHEEVSVGPPVSIQDLLGE